MGSQESTTRSLKIDTADSTTILNAGTIVVASGSNVGNGAISGAAAQKLLGVTIENTDPNGYAGVECGPGKTVKCQAGATPVSFGDRIVSDATGQGIPFTPLNSGALKQIVGIALTAQATRYATFDLMLQPSEATG